MPNLCRDCSNKTQFIRKSRGCAYFDVNDIVDENEECIEYGDYDYDDHDISDSELQCRVCMSENVEYVEQDEWYAWEGPEPQTKEKLPTETWKERFNRVKG